MADREGLSTPGVRISFDFEGMKSGIRELIRSLMPPEKIVAIVIAGGKVIEDQWKILEAPHTVTGEYQRTILTHVEDAGPDFAEVSVGTTAKQARFLEFGTINETAQPVMRPAYDLAKGPASAAMQAEMVKR